MEQINSTAVLVRWEEPVNHGSPYLTGYRLCYDCTDDSGLTPIIQSVSIEVTLEWGKVCNISVYAISKSDKTAGKSHPGTVIFIMGKCVLFSYKRKHILASFPVSPNLFNVREKRGRAWEAKSRDQRQG